MPHTELSIFSNLYKDYFKADNGSYIYIYMDILALIFSLLSIMISTDINLSIFNLIGFTKWSINGLL